MNNNLIKNIWESAKIAASYLAWQEFNIIKEDYPEYLDCVDDDYLNDLIIDVIKEDKLIEFEDIKYIL